VVVQSLAKYKSGVIVASIETNKEQAPFFFLLEHLYEDDRGEHLKTIGLFSTKEKAEGIQALIIDKPGFMDHPDGFILSEIYVDKPEWLEGFGF